LIARVTSTTADATDRSTGLLAYLQVELECGLVLDGITLRRTRLGALTLSFPERRNRAGLRHPIIRPSDGHTRRRIERAVFEQLALGKGDA